MASRDAVDGTNQARKAATRRRGVVTLVGAAGAFAAAAAMATGSAVTAAPAKADIDALLDPIVQPLMTSLSDAISGFDPAAATDLTSWTDSLLASLDVGSALPAAAEPAAAVAASSTSGPYDIPLSLALGTEPTVQATVDGANNTLLVDTGSSGLVLPWEDLGSNDFSALVNLFQLGMPTGISESGYSGGVDYIYLTYNNVPVDYLGGTGLDTSAPIDVEVLSWPTAFGSPLNFEQFLADDHVTGILGIGDHTGGPTTSPLESYGGVLVDIPDGKLIVDSANPGMALATVPGNPIADLFESVNGGTPVAVSDDVDSGGVYGEIPSSLIGNAASVPNGTVIAVYDNAAGTGTPLYTYTVTEAAGNAPTPVSGNAIDSGVEPFLISPIYISYTGDNMVFDKLGSIS